MNYKIKINIVLFFPAFLLLLLPGISFSEEAVAQKAPASANISTGNVAQKNNEVIANAEKERRSYIYNPEGKRDPFKPPYLEKKKKVVFTEEGEVMLEGLQQYQIRSLSLKGIITKGNESIAMIKAPDGRVYIIKDKSKIGPSGVVREIRPSEVIIENEITIKEGDESGNIITRKERKGS